MDAIVLRIGISMSHQRIDQRGRLVRRAQSPVANEKNVGEHLAPLLCCRLFSGGQVAVDVGHLGRLDRRNGMRGDFAAGRESQVAPRVDAMAKLMDSNAPDPQSWIHTGAAPETGVNSVR